MANRLIIDGEREETFSGPISAEDVKQSAREQQIKQIGVVDADTGEKLYPTDFPYEGNVRIHQVNKAGWIID